MRGNKKWNMTKIKILAINGSYRDNGITDQSVNALVQTLETAGGEVEVIRLRDYPIEFCLNCRTCAQQPGEIPGKCVHNGGMQALIDKIEQANGYILASPTNFGSATALFKRFMERLMVYAYWPWGTNAPRFRKENTPRKKAILVSSCAAPGVIGRLFFGAHKQLKLTAQLIGADVVGTGFTSKAPHAELPKNLQTKIKTLGIKLAGV